MKKIIIIILLLMFAVTPAQSLRGQVPSLFDTSTTGRGQNLEYKHVVYLDETGFDTFSQGIFVLQLDTFKAVNFSGLAKFTIRCNQEYPFSYMELYAVTSQSYLLTAGETKFYTAEFVTAESAVRFGVWTDGQIENVKCAVVVEAVK